MEKNKREMLDPNYKAEAWNVKIAESAHLTLCLCR